VTDSVQIDVPRVPDRDELMKMLTARGFDPRPVDDGEWLGVEIPCDGDAQRACEELIAELESWVSNEGIPFVPVAADGVIFLRPPAP
jgi:hypothetical protein